MNRYAEDDKEKSDARNWMMKRISTTPSRILTLPSRRGFCAAQFRKEWKNAEIIGIERARSIVQDSALVQEGILNAFYCVGDDNMLADTFTMGVQKEHKTDKRIGYEVMCQECAPSHLGKFDLLFLDYTCSAFEKIPRMNKFIALYANPRADIFATFTRRISDAAFDVSLFEDHYIYRDGTVIIGKIAR
jgi:hypothetical protein